MEKDRALFTVIRVIVFWFLCISLCVGISLMLTYVIGTSPNQVVKNDRLEALEKQIQQNTEDIKTLFELSKSNENSWTHQNEINDLLTGRINQVKAASE